MRLFLLFLLVPLIEIALFIQVGGFIGLWWTLGIVILTAVLGAALVRSQGLAVLSQIGSSIGQMQDPTEPLAHGAMILFSGALLLTPGFFTDIVGFLLLVPGVRGWIFKQIRDRLQIVQHVDVRGPQGNSETIDGEFEEIDPQDGPSGWTRH